MYEFKVGGSQSQKDDATVKTDDDSEYEGALVELAEGVSSGVIGIGQGILELGASGVDLIADTDYASSVTDGAETLRDTLGIDPEGIIGKGAEVITQFAVPGLGAASAVSKGSKIARALGASKSGNVVSRRLAKGTDLGRKQELARLGRITALTRPERLALGAQQVAAAGLADAVVATDGTTTIADFFEGGPTQTDQEIGLSGREEASRRLLNKLKIGVEGAGATVIAPAAVGLTATVAGKGAQAVGLDKAASYGARKILEGGAKVKDVLDDLEYQRTLGKDFTDDATGLVSSGIGKLKNAVPDTLAALRYRGVLPYDIGETRSLVQANVQGELKTATARLDRIEKGLDRAIKDPGVETGDLVKQDYFNKIEEFLTTPSPKRKIQALKSLPPSVQDDVVGMRRQIDDLSKDIMNSDFIKTLEGITPTGRKVADGGQDVADTIRQTINKNLNSYMRRKYRFYEDAKYTPDQQTIDDAVAGFKTNKRMTEYELQHMVREGGDETAARFLNDEGRIVGEVTDEQAKMAVKNFLERKSVPNKSKRPKQSVRVAEDRLKTGMLLERERLRDFQKRLLGEIKDPQESFIGTIADLAEFKAIDNFYGMVRNEIPRNETLQKLFKDTANMTPAQKKNLKERDGYVILGEQEATSKKIKTAQDFAEAKGKSGWGSLQGYAVPEAVYNQLTKSVGGGVLPDWVKASYGGLLKLKGASQYAKTVLSPITQIRNFTTAALFATAQGNVGRGANLGESIDLVLRDIGLRKSTEEITEELAEMQRLGIIGTQAELREIQDLIRQGAATKGSGPLVEGAEIDPRLQSETIKKLKNNYVAKLAGAANQKAQDLYKGSDDVWKIYNFKFEQNKLKNALRGSSPEEQYFALAGRAAPEGSAVTPQMIDDLIKEESARIVRNTVPNYNLAPEAIKTLRKMPIGNFITFPYEIMRTGTNTITRGIQELASTNPEIQKIGMRRLTGALTTYAAAPIALTELGYMVSGVTAEAMAAYKRSGAPDWERNATLIPVGRNDDGNIEYINYSYSNPYDYLTRFASGALNAFDTSQRTGEDLSTNLRKALGEAASELASPFTDQSMIAEALIDVLPAETGFGRGGNRISGARIYNPEDDGATQMQKSANHVINSMLPGAVPVDVRGGEFEPSRFLRGVASAVDEDEGFLGISPKDRYGRERNLREEMARAMTGVTVQEVDPARTLEYKGFEFREARQDTSGIFNSVARRENVTPEQLFDAYVDANEARFRVFNRFHQTVEDMRTMGMSDREIRKTLEDAGVGGVNRLIRGDYEPLEVSKTIRDEMRRNGTIGMLPRGQINSYRAQQKGREFGAEEEAPADTGPISAPTGRINVGPLLQQQSTTSAPAVAPSITAPATGTTAPATRSSGRINVSPLLVPDPATRSIFGIK
jgi:hypothetical protein